MLDEKRVHQKLQRNLKYASQMRLELTTDLRQRKVLKHLIWAIWTWRPSFSPSQTWITSQSEKVLWPAAKQKQMVAEAIHVKDYSLFVRRLRLHKVAKWSQNERYKIDPPPKITHSFCCHLPLPAQAIYFSKLGMRKRLETRSRLSLRNTPRPLVAMKRSLRVGS